MVDKTPCFWTKSNVQRNDKMLSKPDSIPPEWPKVIPLNEMKVSAWPVDKMAPPLDRLVEEISESCQVDTAMPGVQALGRMSALFQNGYTLRVRPDWTETLSLYVAAIAKPAERKSAVLRLLTDPFRSYEWKRQDAESASIRANEQEYAILSGKQARLLKQIQSVKPSDEDEL